MQNVTGPRWARPVQFPSRADNASGDGQSAFDLQPHGDRRRVPAARGKASKEAAFRSFTVKMKRLWVEFPCKGFDLRFVNQMCSGDESLTRMKVFEKEALI